MCKHVLLMAKLWAARCVKEARVPNAGSQNAPWYVVQVSTGAEAKMCNLIRKACDACNARAADDADRVRIDECFSPRFRSQKKCRNGWRDVERPLMPGYVIVAADKPALLAKCLHVIPEFCRMVATGETYVPLTDYERSWVEAYTEKGDRVVPMSFGYREGDTLEVTQGPLKGREGQILKIDRANSLAHLEFHVGQITIKTTVGLGIIPQ